MIHEHADKEHFRHVTRVYEVLKETDTLKVRVDTGRGEAVFNWYIDANDYEVSTNRPTPHAQRIFEQSNHDTVQSFRHLKQHLGRADLDTLVYFTSSTHEHLQTSMDRMDWFFFVDHFLDEASDRTKESISRSVNDMIQWTFDHDFVSEIAWVNMANSVLRDALAGIEASNPMRPVVLENFRFYLSGLVDEGYPVCLSEYIRNRTRTGGVYPEIEACFAYQDVALPQCDLYAAEMMKYLASYAIGIHNDVSSSFKETKEEGHTSMANFFADGESIARFLDTSYKGAIKSFMDLRPRDRGPLHTYWQVCQEWICGSVIWHFTNRRHNLGNIEILGL